MAHTLVRRVVVLPCRCVIPLVLAVAFSGCQDLDLGPAPDSYVGPGRNAPRSLTDPLLEAVTPVVAGDVAATGPTSAAAQPASSGPAGTASEPPGTLPGGYVVVPPAVSVQQAVLVGLENSASLRVSVYSVPIQRTSEEQAVAAFDPTVTGSLQGGPTGSSGGGTSQNISGQVAVKETLPTGTTVSAGYNTNNTFDTDSPASSSSGVTLSVTQQLLRGAGLDVNLATLRQRELGTKISQYELRGVAQTLVSDIESAYWDYVFATWNVKILQDNVDLAQAQLNDTNARIDLGSIAQSERAAAEAQVATKKQALIDAQSTLNTARLTFLQLITAPGEPFWDRDIKLSTDLFVPAGTLDPVEKHVEVALRLRPDINQAKLQIQQGDLTVVQTKNGLLPQLQFFANLSKSGFAENFGRANSNLNGADYQAIIGISGEWEPFNRAASAVYRQSVLSREQLEESLRNLTQVIQLNVRVLYSDVVRTRLQIDAAAVTLKAQQTAYDVEVAKFKAQNSTSLLVATAQNNLLAAQLGQKQAMVNYLKALVALYSYEGSLLIRRGLDAPGAAPAPDLAWRH